MAALRDYAELSIDEIEALTHERVDATLAVMNDLDIMDIDPGEVDDYFFEAVVVGSLVTSRWDDFRLEIFVRYVFDESFNTSGDWHLYRGLASALKERWPDDGIDPATFPFNPVDEAVEYFSEYDAALDRVREMWRESVGAELTPEEVSNLPAAAKPCLHMAAICCREATRYLETKGEAREAPAPGFDFDWNRYR